MPPHIVMRVDVGNTQTGCEQKAVFQVRMIDVRALLATEFPNAKCAQQRIATAFVAEERVRDMVFIQLSEVRAFERIGSPDVGRAAEEGDRRMVALPSGLENEILHIDFRAASRGGRNRVDDPDRPGRCLVQNDC